MQQFKKKYHLKSYQDFFFLIFPWSFCLVSNVLVGKAMEKKAKIHKITGRRTAVAGPQGLDQSCRGKVSEFRPPQIQGTQRKVMFSGSSYDIIPIIKMSLECMSLNECPNREIRHEPQSCFCTVSSTGQSQSILPRISSSLSPSQKPWWMLLVRAGTHLPRSAELVPLSSMYSASSAPRWPCSWDFLSAQSRKRAED